MELNDKVTQLEDEIKILKNEVQAVLLDLRESYLSKDNPFNPTAPPIANQPIIINQPPPTTPPPAVEEPDEMTPAADQRSEPVKVEEPVPEPEPAAHRETAHEEVERAWRPKSELGSRFRSGETTSNNGGKTNLATIAGLTQWVAGSTRRLGRERAQVILDISEMMGHLPPETKSILVKLINLTQDGYSGEVTTRDYMASLAELSGLLGQDNKAEASLFAILCRENDHG